MHGIINIVLLLSTIVLIIVIAVMSRKHGKQQDDINRRFLEAEEAANSVRKRELDPELFYTADLAGLPPVPENDPHKVLRASKRTMIRFNSPVSNLDLKKRYGPSQMDSIALFEENFNDYLKALTEWAASLAEEDKAGDALLVLKQAIVLGSEFRNTYKLAADIYAARRDTKSLDALLQYAEENYFRDPAVQNHVIEYISEKIEGLDI